jgi:phage gpG-like protein
MAFSAIAAGVGAAGALASGIGSIFGSRNKSKVDTAAIAAQNDINFRNYYLQRQIAARQQEMAQAGTRDARGDVTEYVPGVGWVSRPTDTTRGIISASDSEERTRLTRDAVQQRLQRGNQFDRQLREGAEADVQRTDAGVGRQTLDDIRGTLIARNAARANSGRLNAASTVGIRSLQGASGADAIREMSRTAAPDLRTAITEAEADSNPEFEARRAGREGNSLNRYNVLAGRATTPVGQQSAVTDIDNNLSSLLANRSYAGTMGMQGVGRGMTPFEVKSMPTSNYGLDISNISNAVQGGIKSASESAWLRNLFGDPGSRNYTSPASFVSADGRHVGGT